jgi:hypothetical protein
MEIGCEQAQHGGKCQETQDRGGLEVAAQAEAVNNIVQRNWNINLGKS